jgi:hypothetical protein
MRAGSGTRATGQCRGVPNSTGTSIGVGGPSRFGCHVPLDRGFPWLAHHITDETHARRRRRRRRVGSTPAPGPSRHQTQATQPTSYQLAIRSSDRHDSRVIASALLAALHAHVTFVNGVAASSVGEKTSNLAGQRQRQHVPAYRSSCMHGPWGARF